MSKIERVKALRDGATTPGERAAAEAALKRLEAKQPKARKAPRRLESTIVIEGLDETARNSGKGSFYVNGWLLSVDQSGWTLEMGAQRMCIRLGRKTPDAAELQRHGVPQDIALQLSMLAAITTPF